MSCAKICRPADAQIDRREHHDRRDNPKGGYVIRVSVEVCSGAASFRAAVCAESIERAVSLVCARYPGAETTVVFPIDSEAFFAKRPALVPGVILPETPEAAAG
jgi:hypothetical protein